MSEAEAKPNMEEKCPNCGAPLPSGVLAGLCPACLFKQGAANESAVPPEIAPFQPPTIEEVARMFPQLEILAFIGKGGMGAVYKARQPGLDRVVALKILPSQTAVGPGFIERFNREARALARLTHPHIVTVHEFGQVNGLPFFIMEFVDGLNLRQLERAGSLSPREALQIVPQICEALQFAHDEGIVHRDIKPENILVDKKGRVKIADFGIAKILGAGQEISLTETKGAIGTPHYMAPEQLEKPATVDHRADIFSLGVVFYEMLTGELPLGKFAPPSSRKVEVDVRLDEVVLRALERDPERRYQQISQVKTAVDTIGSSSAKPPPVPPPPAGDAIAGEILARDYNLIIGSCVRRAWALVKKNFWPLVGVTALMLLVASVVDAFGQTIAPGFFRASNFTMGESVLLMILYGPLMGGLSLYYLKTIRGEPRTIETAFSGLSSRFLQLFLAGFVSGALIGLGFFCFILPGIYLLVAWAFTLLLVVDKQLDFWSAMELSRKVVTRHWWKVFAFLLVLMLLYPLGVLCCVVGIFVTTPVALIAVVYAYEDIFGTTKPTANQPAGVGPTGTEARPGVAIVPPRAGNFGRIVTMIGLVGVLLFLVIVSTFMALRHRAHVVRYSPTYNPMPAEVVIPATPEPAPEPAPINYTFGPVMERELRSDAMISNKFLDLDTGTLLAPSAEIISVLNSTEREAGVNRVWEALDIRQDSRRFQYITWLRESGADLMFAGDGRIIAFDGIFSLAHGHSSSNWDSWDDLTPEQVRNAAAVADWTRRATVAQSKGQPPPPAPEAGGIYNSAVQLDSREPGGPIVNLLTRDQSVTWYFKTREGRMGLLQIVGFTTQPPVAKIRYKLLQKSNGQEAVVADDSSKASVETLNARLEAASMMNMIPTKDRALAAVAADAARAGEVEIVSNALGQMTMINTRGEASLEAVRILIKRGLRKPAADIAQGIDDISLRDRALSEVAQ